MDKEKPEKIERLIVYVDGFNLYFGLLEAGHADCKWLNIRRLIENMIKPGQTIVGIKYFTSMVKLDPAKVKRQITYIEALEANEIEVVYGQYKARQVVCHRCGKIRSQQNEKMTDVNIATHMITDAYQDKFDVAILVSGDSDLVPPIKAVNGHFTNKRVTVFFPPSRYNASVSLVAKGSLIIGRKKLKDSQFDEEVTKADGFKLRKPTEWT